MKLEQSCSHFIYAFSSGSSALSVHASLHCRLCSKHDATLLLTEHTIINVCKGKQSTHLFTPATMHMKQQIP